VQEELDRLVVRHGLPAVLDALMDCCYRRAAETDQHHVRKEWRKAAGALYGVMKDALKVEEFREWRERRTT